MIKVNMTPGTQRYPNAIFSRIQKLDHIAISTLGDWGVNYIKILPELLNEKPDIFHVQWPESALGDLEAYKDKSQYLAELDDTFKKIKEAGIKIIWTQHNILPHDRHDDQFFQDLYKIYSNHADGLIHHSHWGQKSFHETHQCRAIETVIRHGAFEDEATYHKTPAEARTELNLDQNKRIFLSIGLARKYKNIDQLLECFSMRQDSDDFLIICINRTEDPYSQELIKQADKIKNVMVYDKFMPSEELAMYARASDAFIYAYGENSLTSGSPHLSQAHAIPQVTLPSPYSVEVMGKGGLFFDPKPNIAEGLHHFMDQLTPEILEKAKEYFKVIPPDYQWDNIAQQTNDFYHKVNDAH